MIYTTTWRSVALLRQVVVLLAFFCCSSTYSWSQAVPSSESTYAIAPSPEVEFDSESVRGLLEQLTDRVKELEEQQTANKSTAAKEEKPADSKAPPKDKWKVNLGGHMQLDSIFWADADPAIPETHNFSSTASCCGRSWLRPIRFSASNDAGADFGYRQCSHSNWAH